MNPAQAWTLSPDLQKKLQLPGSHSFFELMAAASKVQSIQLDLVPNEMKLKRNLRAEGREMITMGIWIMAFFMIISLYLGGKVYIKNLRMEKLDWKAGEKARTCSI